MSARKQGDSDNKSCDLSRAQYKWRRVFATSRNIESKRSAIANAKRVSIVRVYSPRVNLLIGLL
jgi:hypothetical protein